MRGRDYSVRAMLRLAGFSGGRLVRMRGAAPLRMALVLARCRRVRCAGTITRQGRAASRRAAEARRTSPTSSSTSRGRSQARARPAGATVDDEGQGVRCRGSRWSAWAARVEFPNEDPIFHNVFSVSGENRFDLELYKRPKSGVLDLPAPRRRARLLQHPPADERGRAGARQPVLHEGGGRRQLHDRRTCPPARYTLKAWHERAGEAAADRAGHGRRARSTRLVHARRLEVQARAAQEQVRQGLRRRREVLKERRHPMGLTQKILLFTSRAGGGCWSAARSPSPPSRPTAWRTSTIDAGLAETRERLGDVPGRPLQQAQARHARAGERPLLQGRDRRARPGHDPRHARASAARRSTADFFIATDPRAW